jgi:electron transfer flavoprotein alpha subunit
MKILLITEQRDGEWNKVSFETLAAAQRIAQQTSSSLAAIVVGKGVSRLADELAGYQLDEVLLIEHDLLDKYTPDGYSIALREVIESVRPDLVLLPHTYRVRDFAPKLAASIGKSGAVDGDKGPAGEAGKSMIGDGIGYRHEAGKLIFVRQMFQGRTVADVVFTGAPPWFASFQAGAFRADLAAKHSNGKAKVTSVAVDLKPDQIRTKPLDMFREAKQAVDLTQAPILVSVGRGIKGPEHIPMAEKLAKLLGGEVSASRPICDEGWLPMDRQIGSSGQTVAPKLYLALGISGAIQHVVGMKGSRTIAAINKDQNAPIFEVADYGIVGDIFEIVPALIEELEKSK